MDDNSHDIKDTFTLYKSYKPKEGHSKWRAAYRKIMGLLVSQGMTSHRMESIFSYHRDFDRRE